MIQDIKVCNIYVPEKVDYDFILNQFSKHPVRIINEIPEVPDDSIPAMIVGCMALKEKYPNHNLFDKNVTRNLTWSYSSKEKKRDFAKEINDFVMKSLKAWLPSDLKLYDPLFHGDLDSFLNKNLDFSLKTFTYFNAGALYLNNKGKNFVLNLKSLALINPSFKEVITNLLKRENILLYSYNNISPIVSEEEILRVPTLENICWIKFGVEIEEEAFFNIIPGYDIKKHIPFFMSSLPEFNLNQEEEKCLARLQEKDFIVRWISKGFICFSPEFKHEGIKTVSYGNNKFASLNYSHKRTITGRIVCDDYYNVQNLTRDGDEKKQIVSRFDGGSIFVCDYVSFESKIALYLSEDENFIKKYWNRDLHLETASIIYGPYESIQAEHRKLAKDVNHAMMFGAGEESLLSKLEFLKNPSEALYNIRSFLSPILNKAYRLNTFQKEHGYIVNDWGYIINPKKDFAAFSNFIQSSAAEILVDKIFEVKKLFKNKESKFLFPIHDSMIFDISPKEKELFQEIPKLLSAYKDYFFAVSCKFGHNYKNLSEEKIFS